jgi:hypothetical protein
VDRARNELLTLADSWRRVLADDPLHARPIVSSLLAGRVTIAPKAPKRWIMIGNGSLIGLFERVVVAGVPLGMASPRGKHDVFRPFRGRFIKAA